MRSTLLILFFATVFAGCIGALDYYYEKQIIGRYYLGAVDSRETMDISYKPEDNEDALAGVVAPVIFAIGHDSDYIVAKQHPGEYKPDKSRTNYFIIKVSKTPTKFPEKEVIGPLTSEQFKNKMSELGRNIPFTTILKDLE